ncbi:MAG: hypothetical protein FWD68_00935 [Alphaproteobacteria bacterium]|nr:hypothetical protein [Alphaproteobacteria bacterium]
MRQWRIGFAAALALLLVPMMVSGSHALVLRPKPENFKLEAGLPPKPADVPTLIQRARDSIARDRPTLQDDIDNLFIALLRSRDSVDHYNLVAAIGEIGDIRYGTSPVRVKNYVRQLVLIVLPRLPADVQSHAGTVWSRLFPSRKLMEREIGIVAPANRVEEEEGLAVLRARGVGVSYDTLKDALTTGDLQLTQALLQAGLNVDKANIESTYDVVWSSLHSACSDPTIPADWINGVIDRLVEYGYPIAHVDSFQHTILFQLVSECSGAVVGHIADLGAPVDLRDPNGVTALEMALGRDRFEAADALLERGARLSPSAAKRTLLFPRQDSRRAGYVQRATEAE